MSNNFFIAKNLLSNQNKLKANYLKPETHKHLITIHSVRIKN